MATCQLWASTGIVLCTQASKLLASERMLLNMGAPAPVSGMRLAWAAGTDRDGMMKRSSIPDSGAFC